MKDIRIAAIISQSFAGKTADNLDGMVKWIKAAKKEGAAVVCFPEMNVTGYSVCQDIKDAAEPVPGSVTDHLSYLAEDQDIVILAGMAEKDENGLIFASHLVVKPEGNFDVYRKLHIAPPERPVFSAGDKVPLFEACGVKFGIQLCYDAHFPELSTLMALKGAEVIFIPHASPRGTPREKYESWMRHLPARAYDNSFFVIACNQTGENGKGLHFPGVAVVIDPAGKIMEKDVSGGENMVVAELKADVLTGVRNNKMHFFLPNRRDDLLCGRKINQLRKI
ncbi:nitrilase-related carbon-nitrogen hydrolase [Desulfonema magnum]|uniref:Carbon-nitrogen hydrolase n=1 Tax=Desulfonema magnum TaxID=45655 RepID=A0A975BVI6_9BACT|nr:nitrilase-related carbon-nitrogen hydrolase [Desulfonema magnum]QTA92408.1 Carbon-nitrogen hydrolase [Desulfonema magnum]